MPSIQDLVSVWLVGLDSSGQPAARSCQPSELVEFIGAAPASHAHDVAQVSGLADALAAVGDQLSSLLSRVSAVEAQLSSGPTYSEPVNQLLQSADAPAMRQAMGISGVQLGDFGQVLMSSATVAQAYAPIEEYLDGRNNG